jgi:hypothetical protein
MNEILKESLKTRKLNEDSARLFCTIQLVTRKGVIVDIELANDLPYLVADFALGDATRKLTDHFEVCVTWPLLSAFNHYLNERIQKMQQLQDPETPSAPELQAEPGAQPLAILEDADEDKDADEEAA